MTNFQLTFRPKNHQKWQKIQKNWKLLNIYRKTIRPFDVWPFALLQFHYRPVQVPRAQKHYKIVFIKAPSPPNRPPPQIPPIPQNEEKTLVYVLVKKPDEPAPIEIPEAPVTPPSKPEVYFIKYKTQVSQETKSKTDFDRFKTFRPFQIGAATTTGW